MERMYQLGKRVGPVVRWLYDLCFPLPPVCPVCMVRQQRLQICAACEAEALRQRSLQAQCQRCHSFGVFGDGCRTCRSWPQALSGNVALWPYRDPWRQVILDLKQRNKPWLAQCLAAELLPVLPRDHDLLVPVPLHPARRKSRGYDQSQLLAEALADHSGIPWHSALVRVRDTPHQTGLGRSGRLRNLEGAFALAAGADVTGRRIVLIDDVCTTGATLLQCAKVLKRHGAAQITGLTLASSVVGD